MTEIKQNFTTYVGNTESTSVPIVDAMGVAYVMTGAVVTWVLMVKPTDSTAVLTKVLPVTENAVTFELTHADTADLEPGTYWHEATAVFLNGDVKTLWTGWATLLPAESAL